MHAASLSFTAPRLAAALLAAALLAAPLACARSPRAGEGPTPVPSAARGDSARRDTAARDTTARDTSTFPTERPTIGTPPSLALPPIVTRELPNGMRLLVVEHHELPLADFILLVRTGGEADPRGKPGVASLAANMLDEGTTTRNALQIADQVAFLGVSLGSGSGWDATTVSLHTPTAQLDSALALFADVVLRPAFPAADFQRVKKERLTSLMQVKDRPTEIADRAYAAILYGNEHPYGRPLTGTETAVPGITRADLQQFYRAYFRPNNATLIVVGDVTPDDVERRARALFGGWQRGTVPEVAFRDPPTSGATTIYLIDKPGAPQSSVRIGAVGVPRSTKDYFAIQVMNTILGGSFTSRLMQNLRETHGYTYGAGSGFAMRRAAGPFTARGEIVAAKTDSAILEFMKELRAIRDTVPSAELTKAKRYLQLQMPAQFETTGDIARQLIPVVLYDLPLDFYNGYVGQIERITQTDVQRVAQQYVDPGKLSVIIVGDRQNIEAGLRALKLGDVTVRDLAGQPVRP
jgi:zinc protease